jgi:VanZ family protein
MRISEWIKKDRIFFAWVPAGLWALNVLIFSVLPYRLHSSLTVGYFDKMCHFGAYGILTFLLMWGIKRSGRMFSPGNVAFALIFAVGYGILIEIFQSFVPGREACVYDALFNSAGSITGISFGRMTLWRK